MYLGDAYNELPSYSEFSSTHILQFKVYFKLKSLSSFLGRHQ
jgi:hypothetical protein